jgi:hypothetical protein
MMDDDALNDGVTDTPEERELLRRLASLPQEAEPERDLWPGIAARIATPPQTAARPPRRARFLAQAAAALLLFASGVAVGRSWSSGDSTPQARQDRDPLAAAVEVQRTGTEYVAALRSLAERPGNAGSREQGCEAALSTLFGAAHELVRLKPGDARTTEILNAVSSAEIRTVRF